jgi:phosphomannomutase
VLKDPIKVYDARWQVSEFDDNAVRRLFEATFLYGLELGVEQVTLCRDARIGAPRLLEIAVDVATSMGLGVWLCPDPVSTPVSYFTTLVASEHCPNTMGLSITASHNPKEYIGVKFTIPIVRAIGLNCGPEGGLSRIREIYHSDQRISEKPRGTLTLVDYRNEYLTYSAELARVRQGSLAGLRVVLDGFHGSAGPELYRGLTWAGATVIARRLIPNGEFPTGSPNPTSQGKMDEAILLAQRENADVVIGVDGDGDRLVFGDARGLLSAGFAFIPILEQGLKGLGDPGQIKVLYDPKVSPLGLVEWAKRGSVPVLFRNGHSQIKDYMLTVGARFAAEESGHYYHVLSRGNRSVAAENSLLCVLAFLAAVREKSTLMDELFSHQSRVFTTGEFNYQFADDKVRDQALSAVVAMLRDEGAGTVTETPDGIDLEGTCVAQGVRLEGKSADLSPDWYSGYLRIATNEKAVVRSYFSAGTVSRGRAIELQVRRLLEERFHGRVVD